MTSYLVRKTGSDANGGTSQTIRSSGADGGVTNNANTSVSSITATWTAADIGHAVNVAGRTRLVTSVTPQTTVVVTANGTTGVSSAALFDASMVGQMVTGVGVPANTIVTALVNPSSMTLSNSVTAGTPTLTLYVKLNTTTQAAEGNFTLANGQAWVVGGSWLTWSQALVAANTPLHSGDSIYVGAGTYRESSVTPARNGTAGARINVIGDTSGAITGDAGEVTLTGYTAGDLLPSAAAIVLSCGTTSHWTFSLITFAGNGSGGAVVGSNVAGIADITFTDCVFFGFVTFTTQAVMNAGLTFDRCHMWAWGSSALTVNMANSATPYDASVLIQNCCLFNFVTSNGSSTLIVGSTNSTNAGGVRIYNSLLVQTGATANQVIGFAPGGAALTTVYPCEVRYSMIIGSATGLGLIPSVTSPNAVQEDWNMFCVPLARTNGMIVGPNSVTRWEPMLDVGQSLKLFGQARPFMSPSSPNFAGFFVANKRGAGGPAPRRRAQPGFGRPGFSPPALTAPDAGAAGNPGVPLPTVDMLNRPRPAGGQSNVITPGPYEYHDSAMRDMVTYDVTPSSAKLIGPGDFEFWMPVDSGVAVTLSVRCLLDANYNNSAVPPSLNLLASPALGVAAQTAYASAGPTTWQTITLAPFTPTSTGAVKIRLISTARGPLAQVNFDTLAAT